MVREDDPSGPALVGPFLVDPGPPFRKVERPETDRIPVVRDLVDLD